MGIVGLVLCVLWLGTSLNLWTDPLGLPFDQTWFMFLVMVFVFLPDAIELVRQRRNDQSDG
jgi:hypothetical protein